MRFLETVRRIVNDKEFKQTTEDALEDLANALLGNPVSAAKFLYIILESPLMIREKIFWNKFAMFLDGVYLDDDDKAKMAAKFAEDCHKEENAERMINYIDRAENKQKIQFLINATRCLLADSVKLPSYFRICHTVTNTLYEDLLFLQKNIFKKDLDYNESVQGLFTGGLMYQSVIGEETKYSFTGLAYDLDKFALSYDNLGRYPNPQSKEKSSITPQTQISQTMESFTDEDVQDVFKN